jgi:repressor LexA
MAKSLTRKQRAILEFLRAETGRRGFPPTLREIGEHFGLRSTGSVRDHLRALERKGYIDRRRHLSRGIVLRTGPRASSPRPPRPRPRQVIPLLGEIAAGRPRLAVERSEETLALDPALFGGGELFALRVEGESMVDAGIYPGDHVVVRRQDTAANGDIVVALVDDEATVKRFFHEGRRVRLQPENPTMEPIYLTPRDAEVQLLGRVVGVLRKL